MDVGSNTLTVTGVQNAGAYVSALDEIFDKQASIGGGCIGRQGANHPYVYYSSGNINIGDSNTITSGWCFFDTLQMQGNLAINIYQNAYFQFGSEENTVPSSGVNISIAQTIGGTYFSVVSDNGIKQPATCVLYNSKILTNSSAASAFKFGSAVGHSDAPNITIEDVELGGRNVNINTSNIDIDVLKIYNNHNNFTIAAPITNRWSDIKIGNANVGANKQGITIGNLSNVPAYINDFAVISGVNVSVKINNQFGDNSGIFLNSNFDISLAQVDGVAGINNYLYAAKSISETIRDEMGNPISGAKCDFVNASGNSLNLTTDADGEAMLFVLNATGGSSDTVTFSFGTFEAADKYNSRKIKNVTQGVESYIKSHTTDTVTISKAWPTPNNGDEISIGGYLVVDEIQNINNGGQVAHNYSPFTQYIYKDGYNNIVRTIRLGGVDGLSYYGQKELKQRGDIAYYK